MGMIKERRCKLTNGAFTRDMPTLFTCTGKMRNPGLRTVVRYPSSVASYLFSKMDNSLTIYRFVHTHLK